MKVNSSAIYIDAEDEMIALTVAIQLLDKKFRDTSAKWMWLNSEWSNYIIQKTAMQKRLRKLKAELGYNDIVAD